MEHMSLMEWLIIIAVLMIIDLLELIIDIVTLGIGFIITVPLDFMVGISFYGYLWLRGEKLGAKRWVSGIITLTGETFYLPLWTADGIYNMMVSLADQRLENASSKQVIGFDSGAKKAEKLGSTIGKLGGGAKKIPKL